MYGVTIFPYPSCSRRCSNHPDLSPITDTGYEFLSGPGYQDLMIMDKSDVLYGVGAIVILLVVALVVKPAMTGEPVNTGIPVPTTTAPVRDPTPLPTTSTPVPP